tara:strand:+ start:6629 stop:7351 length:723 start_codon:yes stop_codon:yes gene_type:complete
MIYNILTILDENYLKLAINNVNSYHRLDSEQCFVFYVDDKCLSFYENNKDKIKNKSKVSVREIDISKYWQYGKILIFEEYFQKEDFVIVDADSLWYSLPKIMDKGITYLSESHKINNGPKGVNDYIGLSKFIENITPQMTNNQIGFLSIPKEVHYVGMVDEWKRMCDEIKDSKEVRGDINRQCEQLSISLITQIKNIPFSFLKKHEKLNDKNIIESLYWSCRGKGNGPGQHQRILKELGW